MKRRTLDAVVSTRGAVGATGHVVEYQCEAAAPRPARCC